MGGMEKWYIGDRFFWAVSARVEVVGERAVIRSVSAESLTGRRLDFGGLPDVGAVLEALNNQGAKYVFAWDFDLFGGLIEYYALKNEMRFYADAEKRTSGRGAAEECWSELHSAAGFLNLRMTLRRTAKTHDNGGGKIGALHTVEYRGLDVFFRGLKITDILDYCGAVESGDEAHDLVQCLRVFFSSYETVTGECVRTHKYLRRVYTIGGAARRMYLRERYGRPSLKDYQREHPQNKEQEEYFRDRALLLPGLCFFPSGIERKLVKKPLKKYDVNGLYTSISNSVGDLGPLEHSTFDAYMHPSTREGYVYILIVKNVILYKKPDVPLAFADPFTHHYVNTVSIEREWAVFGELWAELHKYFTLEEFEIVDVVRFKKTVDPAIIRYNAHMLSFKNDGKKTGRAAERQVAKFFLNNLIGKFTQKTKYVEYNYYYEPKIDAVKSSRGKVIDNWDRGHFHFVRGAYIYTMARVRIMRDILELLPLDGKPHHYYTDTDSIITDVTFPSDLVDDYALGAYKLEEEYTEFGVIAQKVYYGRTKAGEDKLTAAGMPKGRVMQDIHDSYGVLSADEVWDILNSSAEYYVPSVERIPGGSAVIYRPVRVNAIDVSNIY